MSFILDDTVFGDRPFRFKFILGCVKSVLLALRGEFRVVKLSTLGREGAVVGDDMALVRRFAKLNATWELKGEMRQEGRASIKARYENQFARALPAIRKVTLSGGYDVLFIPGGVWGTSGLWAELAHRAGIRIGSFDAGGYGTVMIAGNGVACQLQDIPLAFRLFTEGDGSNVSSIELARRQAQEEMDRRAAGVDAFESQIQGSDGGGARFDGAIMLALNSSWDSAALGLHTVFEDNTEWILQTVELLLKSTDVPVIVRQHPAERLPIAKTSDDYALMLLHRFGDHPRLHFISAADKINSYELMKKLRAVVVYTSTIGIEAAAQGLPVITASSSYYSRLGFVFRADDQASYGKLLMQAASGDLVVSDTARERALLAFYLTQNCNWIFSDFNPWDFQVWKTRALKDWLSDEQVQTILLAIREGTPVAWSNHQKRSRAKLEAGGKVRIS
ncbi:hypothetical protein [Geothrix limicola]|uniref:capsular polysaccharide export protein, LipB/KpsS family n=1 Tax=Geothrix limicola TaxID=2927978 RepID=UPI0025572D00|nr:hypothetical protein [Geothrix limicola]